MDFNKKILDKIDSLIKLSNDFDSGFKIIFNLDSDTLDEKNTDILYSMTKNYILLRKEHGEIILMFDKLKNSVNYDEVKEGTKNKKNTDNNSEIYLKALYDISTFSTLLNNINDLINNIDYEYKKIAIKYPKFINKKQITVILITPSSDEKYTKMINELMISNPEHKYKIIKYDIEKDLSKYKEELKQYEIEIKSLKSLPVIYIINGSTKNEINLSKNSPDIPIKSLIS
jgi:hypothetical protein